MNCLEIVIWDVQHGSAAYIKTPNDTHIVQDLGSGDISSGEIGFSPLLYLKHRYAVERLDYVIITHPHHDHISDILNFDELYPRVIRRPKHLSEQDVRNANPHDDPCVDKYFDISRKYSDSVIDDENPRFENNNGGVNIQIFSPTSCGTSNLNNHSLVSVFKFAGSKILIPGDNEPPSWNELLANPDFVNAIEDTDIFVAPHHGRESAYCSELFQVINPRLTIISDGSSESSAVSKYSAVSRGWTVFHNNGSSEERKCITTRSDGAILVKFGFNDGNKPFINVTLR